MAHPLAALEVTQSRVPLETHIDRIGSAGITANRVNLELRDHQRRARSVRSRPSPRRSRRASSSRCRARRCWPARGSTDLPSGCRVGAATTAGQPAHRPPRTSVWHTYFRDAGGPAGRAELRPEDVRRDASSTTRLVGRAHRRAREPLPAPRREGEPRPGRRRLGAPARQRRACGPPTTAAGCSPTSGSSTATEAARRGGRRQPPAGARRRRQRRGRGDVMADFEGVGGDPRRPAVRPRPARRATCSRSRSAAERRVRQVGTLALESYDFVPYALTGLAAAMQTPARRRTARLDARHRSRSATTRAAPDRRSGRSRSTGPGDVLGVDPGQIVRRYPSPGSTNAEETFHAHIEFDRPELPWAFSAQTPGRPMRAVARARRARARRGRVGARPGRPAAGWPSTPAGCRRSPVPRPGPGRTRRRRSRHRVA